MSAAEAQVIELRKRSSETRKIITESQAPVLAEIHSLSTQIRRIMLHITSELGGSGASGRIHEAIGELKTELGEMRNDIKHIDRAFRGDIANGNRGLLTRVAAIEDTTKRWAAWLGALSTGLLGIMAKLIYDFVRGG